MKTRLHVAACILALSASAHATIGKPEKCPSADAVRAAGISQDVVEQDRKDGTWAVGLLQSKYDTNDSWTFIIGRIIARNKSDAYEKAKATLGSLSFNKGPLPAPQINRWVCGYNISNNYVAITVTPDLKGIKLDSVTHSFN